MAYYLVKAKFDHSRAEELRARLDSGEIQKMRPFGQALHLGLDNMRKEPQGCLVWEEEDYCTPPLAMERAAVLDTYFTELGVESVQRGDGWAKIESLPRYWDTGGGG